MHLQEYGADEHLIRQAIPGDSAPDLSGTAWVRIDHAPSKGASVGEFGPGDVIGEISLLTDEARTADLISRRPVRSLWLSAVDFHKVADKYPEVRMMLTSVVADRLEGCSTAGIARLPRRRGRAGGGRRGAARAHRLRARAGARLRRPSARRCATCASRRCRASCSAIVTSRSTRLGRTCPVAATRCSLRRS